MDKQSLAQLIEISCAVGTRTDYVQAGGGNTSVKSPDGRTMAIKASGTALTAMSESAGWVEVDIAAVLSIFERKDLATMELTPAKRACFSIFPQRLSAARGGLQWKPPSTPCWANRHPHSSGGRQCLELRTGIKGAGGDHRRGRTPPLWVPYTDPGWRLARLSNRRQRPINKPMDSPPAVLFMENHGLLVSAPEAEACVALHAEWVSRCERYFLRQPQAAAAVPRRSFSGFTQGHGFAPSSMAGSEGKSSLRPVDGDAELASVACDERADLFGRRVA